MKTPVPLRLGDYAPFESADSEVRTLLVVERAAGLAAANDQLTREIAERRRVEERLRQSEALLKESRSALQQALARIGVVTASIAHEVNQPLSGIITNATTCLRMLSAEPPNVDGARETATRAVRDGNRAADVIARLRTLYGRNTLEPQVLDLNAAARDAASSLSGELQRNRVILCHDLADDLPPVIGDRIQLQEVILNLLRNASQAMSTIESHPRELLVRTEWNQSDCVRLSVKDAGIGFPPEAAGALFQAFYTTKSDGMGIGLSISRTIVEAHHGRLWATANDGPGATFSFSLPCVPSALAQERNAAAG